MDQATQARIFRNLVGDAPDDMLASIRMNIQMYLTPNLGLFIPYLGHCDYAIRPNHTHPGYSFIYNFTGPASVRVRGKSRNSPFGREANLCAFGPGIPHEEVVEDQFRSYIAICIDRRFYEHELRRYPSIAPKAFEGEFFPAGESVLTAVKRFIAEHEEQLPGRDTLLAGLACEITHLLIRHCHSVKSSESRISHRVEINQLVNHLNEAFAESISVDDMARFANLSPSQLSRVFKKETGTTPAEFLTGLRVQKAKKLLLNPRFSVTEVALNCGFSSSAYFATCFAGRTGLTPTEYRKRLVAA